MNKIFFKGKKRVFIGDSSEINGVKIVITQELVDDNPELFEVIKDVPEYVECIKSMHGNSEPIVGTIYKIRKNTHPNCGDYVEYYCRVGSISYNECFKPSSKEAFDKQELLKEAKRHYPIGAKIKNANDSKCIVRVLSEPYLSTSEASILKYGTCIGGGSGWIYTDKNGWAEVIKPIFTTEDGIDIYNGDKVWWVTSGFGICNIKWNKSINGVYSNNIYFSTEELAKEYVRANKPKDLRYYEDLLLIGKTPVSPMYTELKDRNPKLFYMQVLQEIANDLNEKFENYWYEIYYSINYWCYKLDTHNSIDAGSVKFSSHSIARKAIKIMGDKLDLIFKQ